MKKISQVRRPISITVIGTAMITVGACTLIPKIFVISSPERFQNYSALAESFSQQAIMKLPIVLHVAHGIVGSIVWVAAGAYILRGCNWSRLLALSWGLTVLLLTFLSSGMSLLFYMKAATYTVLLYLLVNPSGSTYFQSASDNRGA